MILTVLKIIGIVVLVILLLLIFILTVVLFTPVRYRFSGDFHSELQADISVKWSPVLLSVTVACREKKVEYVIRLLGGVVMTNTGARLSFIGRKLFASDGGEEKKPDKKASGKMAADTKTAAVTVTDWEEEFSRFEENYADNETANVKQKRSSPGQPQKRPSVFERIRDKISKFRKKVHELIEKLKEINKKKESLLNVYHSQRFALAKKDMFSYIKELLAVIRPGKLKGFIRFGMEDPADTGEILGVAAMFLPLYDGFFTVYPDFGQACFEGSLQGEGKIRPIGLVKLIVKVILNKNLIKVTKKVQTIIEA